MTRLREIIARWLVPAVGLVLIVLGWSLSLPAVAWLGAVAAAVWLVYRLLRKRREVRGGAKARSTVKPSQGASPIVQLPSRKRPRDESEILVQDMLDQGRYALLLRPQIVENITEDQFRLACKALEDGMALVPSGQVVLGLRDEALDDGRLDEHQVNKYDGYVVEVDAVFLDRYPVTNAQFQQFVEGGGYEELALWDEDILAAMLDFVDSTGYPGPRFWRNGHFESRKADHPVVGVSWYEAVAFARWCGKRMATDAEWTKSGCWPVTLGPGNWLQRKFPWGQAFEEHRANIWSSGWGTTVPVHQFSEGMSVGGIHQLIGNVWEWTSGSYGRGEDASLTLPVPMKSIRGGAFDTYFENQATCQFQSGESPLSRKRNIGFRLAVGAFDLTSRATGIAQPEVHDQVPATAEEVTL